MTDQEKGYGHAEPLFLNLTAEDENITEMESLCMNCHEQGTTKLMLTKIPFFKEVIISSFSCDECGHADREVQFGGRFQEKGCRMVLNVESQKDMNRQVVKSDWCKLEIPALEFEQPPNRKGEINTVEGLLSAIEDGIQAGQPVRRIEQPEVADKLDKFLAKLGQLKSLEKPFEIILDDPTGNSFIENPDTPARDTRLNITRYTLTHQQKVEIGLCADDDDDDKEDIHEEEQNQLFNELFTGKHEVISFPANCPSCNAPCDTKMKMVDIPHFKETLIMATSCDVCGIKENEVKGGGAIAEKGTRITLRITDSADLSRDLLKSDTCGVRIPELELELMEGTLGGKFTTLEGLLTNIKDQLEQNNPFVCGDSAVDDSKQKLKEFCEKFNKVLSGEMLGVHFVLDDPAGNSYLQNLYAPDEDPEMTIEYYERTYEQNEALGLNDMRTENYTNQEENTDNNDNDDNTNDNENDNADS